MIIVSDTGPLLYLHLLGHLEVLRSLFGEVVVPASVARVELMAEGSPEALRVVLANPPAWLQIWDEEIAADERMKSLDTGEADALAIALSHMPATLLTDDLPARKRASGYGVIVIGTLGLLAQADMSGLLDFDTEILRLLSTTNFRATSVLIDQIREALRRRKAQP